MKKIIVLLTLLFLAGVSAQAEAVISEEFGGGKAKPAQAPKTAPNGLEARAQGEPRIVHPTSAPTGTTTRDFERRDDFRKERPTTSPTTTEIIFDGMPKIKVKGPGETIRLHGDKLFVLSSTTGSTTEYRLKSALPSFINQLARTWRKEGASTTIKSFEIKIEDGKPIYEVTFDEAAKLFGFIPLKLNRTAVISSDTEKVDDVKQPWYSFLVRKMNLFNHRIGDGVATSTEQTVTTTGTATTTE